MKRVAFMFPGQGSQTVGMGQQLYDQFEDIRDLYQSANEVLKMDIRDLMFHGPKEKLTETENAQPALLLSSIAVHTLLMKENVKADMMIGHSLGEYSALVASGALPLEEALPLVQTRGQLMEQAFPKGQGTMAAVLGLKEDDIKNVLAMMKEDEIVDLANLNCPGQIVISGSKQGIEKASEKLKEAGARRVLPLNVSGPFHSRLMRPANEEFKQSLNQVTFHDASVPVYANVSAEPVTDKESIKELLIKQLYSPVRFEESIRHILQKDIDAVVEIGTGNVLCGLVKKIDRKMKTFAVGDHSSLSTFLTWYQEEV